MEHRELENRVAAIEQTVAELEKDAQHVRKSLHSLNNTTHATSLRVAIMEQQNERIENKTDEQTELIQGIEKTVNAHATKLGMAGWIFGVVVTASVMLVGNYLLYRMTRAPEVDQRLSQIEKAVREKQ